MLKKKHKALEKAVLNAADTIIVTSKTTKTEFQAITSKPTEADYEWLRYRKNSQTTFR